MKKVIFIIAVLSLIYLSAQQTEEVTEIQVDSSDSMQTIKVEQDSLQSSAEIPDSLKVSDFPDSLDFLLQNIDYQAQMDSLGYIVVDGDTLYLRTEDMLEEVVQDTSSIDMEKLVQDLESKIEQKRKIKNDLNLPFVFYKENFHFASPFEPNLQIRKNGFTEISFLVSKTHYFQNYDPLFLTSYKQGFLEFNSTNYDLPVSISEAYLGLGDIEMNHAVVLFQKGKLFGIENLNIEADYIGQDGSWLGKREKSRNFDLHLWHRNWLGKFHFYYTDIDQEISSNKLSNAPELLEVEVFKEKNIDVSFKWESKFLTVGARQQNVKIDSLEMKLKSILFSKQINIGKHFISGSYEYFDLKNDGDFGLFTFSNNSQLSSSNFSNNAFYREEDNFYLNSLINWNFYPEFSILANYEKYGEKNKTPLWKEERKAAGLEFINPKIDLQIFVGQEKIFTTEDIFVESKSSFKIPISKFTVLARNWTLYRNTEELELPVLQTKTDLELNLNLKYNNKIKLGLSHVYLSEYGYFQDFSEGLILNDFMNVNAWLGIQITNKFQIQVDAVNFLNTSELYGYPTSYNLAGRHFNFNVYWLFVN
ncbi:MAG: hypothetical protein K9N09_08270 [Candidatus Cloacimonetes bacterium]|nr:hypothetical protein [Candidatus Cloacimonadota bacterium]MCF7813537.1 hypothetical protein [Candidatus Cloacimonadota bacterium]MCF7868679.1 hypothetical protein [Candidatus Cloacimonadota bacterium]MCF7884191.1 hypothetical protein [Candidatus Cloacimonadota bacterium]